MKINEKYFNIALGSIASSVIAYLLYTEQITKASVIGMGGAIGFNVTLLLFLGFGLQYFQLGTNRDIQAEIYDEHNIAASIYQAGIWIALAMVISKSLV
jgi:uncharacterized membrane protein YjfL (UPF0719 family)